LLLARTPAPNAAQRAAKERLMSQNDPCPTHFDASKLKLKLHATIASDVDAVGLFTDQVMELVRETNSAEGKEFGLEMSLREALANAVLHGCKSDPGKQVECCVACDDQGGMYIVVRDPGEGFDPASVPNPLDGENVLATHGRGIFLINQLMDDVTFESGGREIRMRKF
jgi:serine/threonine-protein kinase RsbW